MKSIDETMEFNAKFAQAKMLEQGHVDLMFVLHTESGYVPIMVPSMPDDEVKTGVLQLTQLLMLKYKAYAYSVMMEAWIKTFDSKEEARATKGEIAKMPGTKETIVISFIGHDRRDTTCIGIKRTGKGKKEVISFEKPLKFDDMSGRFFELLPPAKLIERELDPEQAQIMELAIEMIMMRYKILPLEVVNEKA